MTKAKTTILLATLLLLSLMAGSITPTSAYPSNSKLILIERGQGWERYYNAEKGTYVLKIYASAMSANDPSTTISPPTDDSYVSEYSPDDNYGSNNELSIQDRDGVTNRVFIRFDLSSLPSEATILLANVRLYYYSYYQDNPSGKQTDIHRVLESWDESTITWNNQPSYASVATSSTDMPSSYGWVEWNVTDDVQGMVDGTYDNYGWCIKFHTEGLSSGYSQALFYSKEYDGYDPELYVEYIITVTVNIILVNKTTALQTDDYFQATYTFNGVQKTAQLVNGTNTLTIDNGTWIYVEQYSHLSNSTHRWAMNSTFNETFTEDATRILYYWGQYYTTVSVEKADPDFVSTDADNYFTATGTQFGSTITLSPIYEGNPVSEWLDAQTTLTIDSTSTGSNENEIWDIVDTSWTVTDTSHTFTYWDHLKITLYPQISKPYSQSLDSDNYATVTYTS
ncbi:MAG: hypothetical protein DRO09_02110, partial [Thermoprotei archaeon]